jgi:hypothetical protein
MNGWAEMVGDLMRDPDRFKVKPEQLHDLRIDFGKHRGERWTRLSQNYLRYLINTEHPQAYLARAELERRGISELPDLEITAHAVDRASQNCLDIWQRTRKGDEGLHAWLRRAVKEALERGERDAAGRYLWHGMRLVIYQGVQFPLLKTVMPQHKKGESDDD